MSATAHRRLADKKALIVGADAIGGGIARRFAREGASLAILDADAARAHAVAQAIGNNAHAQSFDCARIDSLHAAVDATAQTLGGLHILVNNLLPEPHVAPLEHQSAGVFAAALGAVTATQTAMQAALQHLRVNGGRIVNVGHRYGEGANEAIGAYNAAAWALIGLTRSAAVEWGQYQIATNLLMPLADTPEFRVYYARRAKVLDLLITQIPLGRMGDPVEDVGAAAVFLACDEAKFVNGEIIYGDGGQHTAAPVLNPGKFK